MTIIGIHEDGLYSVLPEARAKLAEAEIILAPPRHLTHLSADNHLAEAEIIPWPVPYQDGIKILLKHRGRKVVVLASGDPFHFGAATSLTATLDRHEWCSFPTLSSFSLMANALGWPLETTLQFGLHAKPIEKLKPALHDGCRLFVLLRDESAVTSLSKVLCDAGFAKSRCFVFSQMKGFNNSPETYSAETLYGAITKAPLAVAIELVGKTKGLSVATGKPDDAFTHHGQITKQAIRAITVASLAPIPGQHLVDIGAGSGSISVEWMLSHPQMRATAIESNPERLSLIQQNAADFGCAEMHIIDADINDMLDNIPTANAYFIGGGLSAELIETIWAKMRVGARIVVNAVTAESEAILLKYHGLYGGDVMKIDISDLVPLGQKHGWKARYPIVHWRVTKSSAEQ